MDSRQSEDHIDDCRARELYRYFQPTNPAALNSTCLPFGEEPSAAAVAGDGNGLSSPNTTLTSLAQLAALRLNVQRAIIRYLQSPHASPP